jgi:DNA-binding PadR family transcriptional regulator
MKSHSRANAEGASAMRPMTSPINWAMLGLVIERPSYGYELMQRFERDYGEVLPLSNGSYAYAVLDVLEGRGLIEEATSAPVARSGTNRQPKVPYRATAEGRRSYRERMFAQADEDRRQSQLFVRQLAALQREPDVANEILDRFEKACLREARKPGAEAGFADQLLSEESRLAMEGKLLWVEYARSVFSALMIGGGDDSA